MADRYWVGGTANWDNVAGTKWSATSGGAGGASVPTTSDDVFFNASSGSGTVTITTTNTGAKSINCTGFTGTIAGTANFVVLGNVTLSAGMGYTHIGIMRFQATATLTTAGKTFSGVQVNGSGITLTLGDALNISSRTIDVTQGTFDTANYTVTAGLISSSNTNTRTITLGSSTVTLNSTGWSTATTTGLTLNANTSTIVLSAASASLNAGGLTFYNVSFTGTSSTSDITVLGKNTFNDFSVTGPAAVGIISVTFDSSQTINGTFSTTGTAGNRRIWFRSSIYGGGQTLTVNAESLTDADFRDIYAIGAGAPLTGTRIGNRGNNRGITFSTPKNVYWNLAGAQNWSANGWASSSGGTPSTDNFPLAQDTAIFDNTGSVTGTITLDGMGRTAANSLTGIGSIDMSARTTAMTLSHGAIVFCYGSWINGSGTTLSSVQTVIFSGEGTKTLTSAGKTYTSNINIDAYNGTLELADALTITSRNVTVVNGTFDTKGYNVTGSQFISNNSNFRTIRLGASTLTLSGETPLLFTSTNLTFDAGTSTISSTFGSPIFSPSGFTFYNVSISLSQSNNDRGITGSNNTFNNLTLVATSSTQRLTFFNIAGNQTINGTFSASGADNTRRFFVLSYTRNTAVTLTVNTLSANNCDFRDITIAGPAAGTAPTSAGDCGNNSGITFPAPKTVYWNLGGAFQYWYSTGWATTSGGTPAAGNFPLPQDTAVFNNTGTAPTSFILPLYNVGTIDMSARTNAMTFSISGFTTAIIYGNFLIGTGITVSKGSSPCILSFENTGTSTITSNGITIGFSVTVNNIGTVQLADALVIASTETLNIATGTFDAVSYNVTTGLFSSAANSIVKMGSGTWTLSGTGTVWSNLSNNFYKGTADILLSDTSTTARTFAGNGLSYNKLTIGGATGISTLTITGNNQFTELASTKTVAHTIALGTTAQTFGKWTVTGTSGNTVTLTGTGTSHILAGAATSGIDYLVMGSIGFAATSLGEFYAGANSTGTAGAPVYRTAPPAARTVYWVGGSGNWNSTTKWSTSSGGASGAAVPRSTDDVVFDSSSNATAYTATVNLITGGNRVKSLTIAGPASGNLTLEGTTGLIIHDNVSLPATGLTRTYTGDITLSGSQTGRTFTTNGVALASNITVNGVNSEWILGSALDNGSSNITVTNGTLDLATYNLTAGSLNSNNSNSRTIDFGSGTLSLSGSIDFGTTEAGRTVLSLVQGTSQVNLSSSTATLSGNNKTFYNVAFTSTATGTRIINGANSFNNLSLTASATGLSQLEISENQTVTGTFTCAGSSVTQRGFVRSNVLGTSRTITVAAASANDSDFRDITVAGAAAPISPTRGGNCGGNSGITFPAAKTVYRVGTDTTWAGSSSWATSSGGAGSNNNFPLAQDTAVIDQNTTLTGTLSLDQYNISALTASTRTTGITLDHSAAVERYGSYTLGSGVTVSGTSAQTFSGRNTMVFTSAGKTITFPIIVNTPSGTFQLGDATTTSNTITHTLGTFNANNFALTATAFASSNSNTRTVTMGSGTWTLSGTGTVWDTSTSTNLTLNASNILLSDTSTTARSFSGGGLSYSKLTIGGTTGDSVLSISGFNSFSEIASTKTVAHTIRFADNQRTISNWTVTGTSGNVVTIDSSVAGTQRLIQFPKRTSAIDYLNIRDVQINPVNKFYAGANSINTSSTFNIYFEDAPPIPPPGGKMFFMF